MPCRVVVFRGCGPLFYVLSGSRYVSWNAGKTESDEWFDVNKWVDSASVLKSGARVTDVRASTNTTNRAI